MEAAVAIELPEAAAKPAQAKLVATASPPGRRDSHSRIALKRPAVRPE